MGEYSMDEHQAFEAMSRFIWQFANRAGDDLLTLLGDISMENGKTFDPAAWTDWMECVKATMRTNS
ncbi:hypothetical protein [Streptomyces sp. YS-3]|uniref:hypothetical protein n=1 Tax=Streptomyces sp. YS-3 TaxID=3381352 RepID=UPI003862A273